MILNEFSSMIELLLKKRKRKRNFFFFFEMYEYLYCPRKYINLLKFSTLKWYEILLYLALKLRSDMYILNILL